MAERITVSARLRSMLCALRGLRMMLRTQHNAWIHAAISVVVIIMAALLRLSAMEWIALIIALAVVWSAEALNTAIELLADAVSPDHHPLIGQAKDVAAGAVLIVAIGAAVVGSIILGPPLLAACRLVG